MYRMQRRCRKHKSYKKYKKYVVICLAMLMFMPFILSNATEVFANQDEDQIRGYNDGYKAGEDQGKSTGHYDRMRNRSEDWEREYNAVLPKLNREYDLDTQSSTYKIYFREGFKDAFPTAYKTSYQDMKLETGLTPKEQGELHGTFFGKLSGEVQGRKDYNSNLASNWGRDFPSNDQIIQLFGLRNDDKEYREAFLEKYKEGYKEHYEHQYRMANYDNHRVNKEQGIAHGIEAGNLAGGFMSAKYRLEGVRNDWQEARKIYISTYPLDETYSLLKESAEYRQGFIEGFTEGFKLKFTAAYQDSNMTANKENVNYKTVSMFEEQIAYKETVIDYVSGAEAKRQVTLANLQFAPGTIYRNTLIGLTKEEGSFDKVSHNYYQVNEVFEVHVVNNEQRVLLNKPVVLSFDFYGSERAGIYQLLNGQWVYQNSTYNYETHQLSAEIPAGAFTGGKYAIFIDDRYRELRDISMHWAKDELYTYLRRHYIEGDGSQNFMPQQEITRGDLLVLLSKVDKWKLADDQQAISGLADHAQLGSYAKVVNYVLANGIMKPGADNRFDVNSKVPYWELEQIISDVMGQSFSWNEIADKMMHEKYTRSQSVKDTNAKLTRGEAVYMLHELEKMRRM